MIPNRCNISVGNRHYLWECFTVVVTLGFNPIPKFVFGKIKYHPFNRYVRYSVV